MNFNQKIYQQIRKILCDRYAYPIEQIQPEIRFQIELAVDSLEMFEIIGEFEELFDIVIEKDDIDKFIFQSQNIEYINEIKIITIKDAVDYIEKKIIDRNQHNI